VGINPTWDEWGHLHLIQRERLRGSQRWTKNFVMDGFGLAAGVGLQVLVGQVGDNFAYVNGFEIKQVNQVALALAASATNHVYLKFTKTPDPTAGTAAITIGYEVNTLGIPPTDSIKLGEVDTNVGAVTAIRQQGNQYHLHDVQLDTDLEGRQHQLKRVTFEKGTAFPTNPAPVAGEHFVRTDLPGNPEFIFNGATWVLGSGGSQGAQGPTGSGAQGNQGNQGMTGVTGSTGAMGPQGNQGNQGQGAQGPAGGGGSQGPQGSAGAGVQGSQGPSGMTGATGPQGNQGASGPAGSGGPQGNQGFQGDGNQGPQGPSQAGVQGPQGNGGNQGNQGNQGGSGAGGVDPYEVFRYSMIHAIG